MVYLDNFLEVRNKRLLQSQGSAKRVLTGEKRKHVVDEIVTLLRDWRDSPFQHEASAVTGMRASLCLAGHGWSASQFTAEQIVEEGLRRLGAKRPSWAEGQWEYVMPRHRCVRCGGEIDDDDQAQGFRHCSSVCASASRQAASARGESESRYVYAMAAQEVIVRRATPRPCAHCGKSFRSTRADATYCSSACRGHATSTVIDRNCAWCGEVYRNRKKSVKCCSKSCGGRLKAEQYRQSTPEQSCVVCSAVFRPAQAGTLYCSRACQKSPAISRAYYLNKKARQSAVIIHLTPAVFDEMFKIAA